MPAYSNLSGEWGHHPDVAIRWSKKRSQDKTGSQNLAQVESLHGKVSSLLECNFGKW